MPLYPDEMLGADGELVHIGYGYGWDGTSCTKPVYIDDHRLVVGTQSGFLLLVDVAKRESTIVHDLNTTIHDLLFCPEQQLLLAGGENGTLTVFSVRD
jgi:hypothetical protein